MSRNEVEKSVQNRFLGCARNDQVAAEAFGVLSQGPTKAVETIVGLLDNKEDRLKRLTAKDIIDFIMRHKENEDLERRLTEVEKRVAEQSGY